MIVVNWSSSARPVFLAPGAGVIRLPFVPIFWRFWLHYLHEQINKNGDSEYYKVSHYTGIQISRWWYGEGRIKTVEYLDNDFSEFMKFLDELVNNLEVDPFCKYAKMAKDVRMFIDSILTGLHSLKKTYPNTEKMKAKVDSIILTLLDFKEKTEDYITQKHKGIKLLIGTHV